MPRRNCTIATTPEKSEAKLVVKFTTGRAGHQPHFTGTGKHDSRPKRQRTRASRDRAEIRRSMS